MHCKWMPTVEALHDVHVKNHVQQEKTEFQVGWLQRENVQQKVRQLRWWRYQRQYGLYNSPKAVFNSGEEVPEILTHQSANNSTTWLWANVKQQQDDLQKSFQFAGNGMWLARRKHQHDNELEGPSYSFYSQVRRRVRSFTRTDKK